MKSTFPNKYLFLILGIIVTVCIIQPVKIIVDPQQTDIKSDPEKLRIIDTIQQIRPLQEFNLNGEQKLTPNLLSHLDNSTQLSVVLSHEIGHMIARTASQEASDQHIESVSLIGGTISSEKIQDIPSGDILGIGSMVAQLLFSSYSPESNMETAHVVQFTSFLLYKTDFATQFFVSQERKSNQLGLSTSDRRLTHPDPIYRENSISDSEQSNQDGYELAIGNTIFKMDNVTNMIFGEKTQKGFILNGDFYHPKVNYNFDNRMNSRVINQRALVAVENGDQDAVSIMMVDDKAESAEASVNEFLNQVGITTLNKSNITSNGLITYHAEATGQTANGTQLKFYLYVIEYNGLIYRFLNYSSLENYSIYGPRFKAIIAGFAELTDSGIMNIQPGIIQATKTSH